MSKFSKCVALAFVAVTLPNLASAALNFDLISGQPFPGYDVDFINNDTLGADQAYDAITPQTQTTSTFTQDSNGNLTFNQAAGFAGDVWNVDLNLNNITSPPPGTQYSINELELYYLSTTSFAQISVIYQPGTASEVYLGTLSSGVSEQVTTFRFLPDYGSNLDLLMNPGETETLRFQFEGFNSSNASFATLNQLSITAIVPEPSSAMLLTGVLGLFSSVFRRRRKLSAA